MSNVWEEHVVAPLWSTLPSINATLWMEMGRITRELFLLGSSSARREQYLLSSLEVSWRCILRPKCHGCKVSTFCLYVSQCISSAQILPFISFWVILISLTLISCSVVTNRQIFCRVKSRETLNGEEVLVSGSYATGETLLFLRKIPSELLKSQENRKTLFFLRRIPFKLSKSSCPHTVSFGHAWWSGHHPWL